MKRVRLYIIVAGIAAFGTAAFAAEVTEEQQARLVEIEQYIDAQKLNVENHYDRQLAALSEQMRSGLLPLEVGENRKFVRAGFVGWAQYIEEVLRQNGSDLRKDEDYRQTLATTRRRGLTAVQKFDESPRLLAIAEKRLADEQLRARLLLAQEEVQINNERQYAIEAQLPDLEEKLKQDVLNPAAEPADGVVSGIVYSQDKPAVILGRQIVHLGEYIGKVRVTAISIDGVEFERAGKRWTQKPGDAAAAGWR